LTSAKAQARLRTAVRYIVLSLFAFASLFPFYWMFTTSLKTPLEWVSYPPTWFPEKPNVDSYIFLLGPSGHYFSSLFGYQIMPGGPSWASVKPIFDNIILSGLGAILTVLLAVPASYSLSRYRRGENQLLLFIMLFEMIPQFALLVPLVIFFSTLQLIDTYLGMTLGYTVFTLPLAIWFLKGFFDAIPKEIDEAALTDGCTRLQVLYKALLPLLRAGLSVTTLFVFILNWSDLSLELGLVLSHGRVTTIPAYMAGLLGVAGQLYGPMSALGTIAVIPVFAFGLAIQKYLVRGFTSGAIR